MLRFSVSIFIHQCLVSASSHLLSHCEHDKADEGLHFLQSGFQTRGKTRDRTLLQQTKVEKARHGLLDTRFGTSGSLSWPKTKRHNLTRLDEIMFLDDFETAAENLLSDAGWSYFHYGAGHDKTLKWNLDQFSDIQLRPRVMVDVREVNTTCELLGASSALPLFLSPAAHAALAHPDAEAAIARAAGHHHLIQGISKEADLPLEAITAAKVPGETQWCQLYVKTDRKDTVSYIKRMNAAGCAAILLTVDTAVIGERVYLPFWDAQPGSLGNTFDANLTWDDIAWIKSQTTLPVAIKGILTGEDALLAVAYGADAIIVSNHGGRQLDPSRATLAALVEVVAALKKANASHEVEVFMDGGIRSGAHIYMALALGAKAVGIGRTPMFALAFGEAGVDKALSIIREEFESVMRLMGKTSLSQISSLDLVLPSDLQKVSPID